jgi:hypothetical protein
MKSKTIEIVITERSSDFHACIAGHPEVWGCGKTPAYAVEDMISAHPEEFDPEP